MIARQAGIGNIVFVSLDLGAYDTVYAMIVIIGMLGILFDVGFEMLRRRLVGWADSPHTIMVGSA
jgi:NitT/TauT family transport system permease protein